MPTKLDTLLKVLSRRPEFHFRQLVALLAWGVLATAALTACDLTNIKPSTSAPGGVDNISDLWAACHERDDAITEWAEKRQHKVTEDVADRKITFLRAALEYERITEESKSLKAQLWNNCEAKADASFSPAPKPRTAAREQRAPTQTPGPTPTPGPSPTPTRTPLPTPTPTLLQQARANGANCIPNHDPHRRNRRWEILVQEDGTAFAKAGLFNDPARRERVSGGTVGVPAEAPAYFRYWKYGPQPGSTEFACKQISFREYPPPVLKGQDPKALTREVDGLADESCRNAAKFWRDGESFLDTDARRTAGTGGWPTRFQLRLKETRPVNERFALALIHLSRQVQLKPRPIGGRATWGDWTTDSIYMVYDVTQNKCRETEYAAKAWQTWPAIAPELSPESAGGEQEPKAAPENTPPPDNTPQPGSRSPLTARFLEVPPHHNGTEKFKFELRFSEEFEISYLTLRDHALTVTGGTVTSARRLAKASNTPNIRWEITVQPEGTSDVSIRLPETADCNVQGAICTGDGRRLSDETEINVARR